MVKPDKIPERGAGSAVRPACQPGNDVQWAIDYFGRDAA
jgi:hypothetical protein